MSERVGVVNLHLVVDVTEDNTMTTLYKIDQGFVKENHYGLKLARVVDLPSEVLTVAEKVSQTLDAQVASKKKSSKAFALAKRRKLVLSLVETLKQAESSPMDDKVLLNWLWKLQCEFVRRMEEIESDTRVDTEDISEIEDRETPRDTAPSETQASDTLN
jgi:DNA mismatch repair protein MSH4